jgi:hypothetical protein
MSPKNNNVTNLRNLDQDKGIYIFFAFILSYMFYNIFFLNETKILYNGRVFLYAAITSLILFAYQKSIRLCGVVLIIIIFYIIKKNMNYNNSSILN